MITKTGLGYYPWVYSVIYISEINISHKVWDEIDVIYYGWYIAASGKQIRKMW